jgi:hypothetical protein
VQDLADAQMILATGAVVDDPRSSSVLSRSGIAPISRPAVLRGIEQDVRVYALP